MYSGESSRQGDQKRRGQLLRTVARFSNERARLQGDAVQICLYSPLNMPQHLGADAVPTSVEASTYTNTIDPGTSEEQGLEGKMPRSKLQHSLLTQFLKAGPMQRASIRRAIEDEDVLKKDFATGELSSRLSSDDMRALRFLFSIDPAVTGLPTGIINDTRRDASVADAGSTEDDIVDHTPDFFNAFEDAFDNKDPG